MSLVNTKVQVLLILVLTKLGKNEVIRLLRNILVKANISYQNRAYKDVDIVLQILINQIKF